MADDSLTYKLFGKDVSASRTLEKVGDTADKTGRDVEQSTSRMSKGLATVGKFAAGAAAGGVLAFGAAIVQGTKDAASYQQLADKTAAVLKSTGNAAGTSVPHVQELAGSLESLSGTDEELIINSQNVLATFTGIQNKAGKNNDVFDQATTAALNLSTAMGSDLQGATVQVGKALNDPIKGITALSRVGVSFTKQQKDQIKAMVAAGDTMGAQKLILAELNKEFGGAAEAAGKGFTGSVARAKDAVGDMFRSLGTLLLPVLTKVANWVATKGVPALTKFGQGFKAVYDLIVKGDFTSAFRKIFGVTEDSGTVKNLLKIRDVVKRVGQVLVEAFQGAVRWVRGSLIPAYERVANSIMPTLRKTVDSVTKTFREHQDIVRTVKAVFKILGDFVTSILIPVLGQIVKLLLTVLGPAFEAVATVVSSVVIPVLRFILKVFLSVVQGILVGAAKAFGWVPGLGPKLQAAADKFGQFRDRVNATLDGIKDEDVNIYIHQKVLKTASGLSVYAGAANVRESRVAVRAKGGPVTRGQPYIIGERGMELFVPAANGFVVPNDRLLGASRAGTAVKATSGDTYNIYVTQPLGTPSAIGRAVEDARRRSTARGYGFGTP